MADEAKTQTALAQQRGQLSTCSGDEARKVFRNELTACLALTAPAGMTEDSRREWLAVAWDTLKDIPPNDLSRAARMARQTCDHPAKIVPAIVKAVGDFRPWEKFIRAETRPERLIAPQYVTPTEAAQILRETGFYR